MHAHSPKCDNGHPPGKHATATDHDPAPGGSGRRYTCPMHPEIIRDAPGTCPICGMALEPMMPAEDDENPELADFRRRFWWTLPLTAGRTGAGDVRASHDRDRARRPRTWIELVLTRAGGALGRLAVLRALRAIAAHRQAQHVDADRHRRRRGIRLQRGGRRWRPACFRIRSASTAGSACISRRRR